MTRDQRNNVFFESFFSKRKEKKQEEISKKISENLKKFNETKKKVNPLLKKAESLVKSNLKEYKEDNEENILCKFKYSSSKEDKDDKHTYSETLSIVLTDNGDECSWEIYNEIVSPARETMNDRIKTMNLDNIIHESGKANEITLTLEFNSKKGLDGKKY